MALESLTTWPSFYANTLANLVWEPDELASTLGPAKESNIGKNKALTPSKAPTPPFVYIPTKNLFTTFMKVFIETI